MSGRYLADFHLVGPLGEPVVLRVAEPPGFRVLPADDPARPYYRPCAERLAGWETGLFSGAAAGGRTRIGKGDVVLRNGDGWFDAWQGHSWVRMALWQVPDGRFVPWANAVRRFQGLIRRVDYDGDEVLVRLADLQAGLDRPVARAILRGDNVPPAGLEGLADLRDREKPVGLGRLFGVPGTLVNPQLGIWQVNDGPVHAVTARVGGALVPSAGDAGGAIGDPGLSVPGDRVVTDLARGYVRFGFAPNPDHPVTFDLDGDVTGTGGVWPSTGPALLRHLAVTRLGHPAGEVDDAAVAAAAAAWPHPCGLWAADGAGGLDALDRLAAAFSGWWTVGFDGRLTLGALTPPPAGGPFDLTITDADRAVTVKRRSSDDPWADAVAWRVEVTHSENLTPMQDSQMVGSLSDAWKDRLRARWPAPAVAEDPAILTASPQLARRPDGGVLKVESRLADAAGAQALADRLLTLRRPGAVTLVATLDAARAARVRPGSAVRVARAGLGLAGALATRLLHLSTTDGVEFQAVLWGRP